MYRVDVIKQTYSSLRAIEMVGSQLLDMHLSYRSHTEWEEHRDLWQDHGTL